MPELLIDGNKIEGNDVMREGARSPFLNLFSEDFPVRPLINNLQFDRLDNAANSIIEAEFTESEILECPRDCDGDKSLGPNGFNVKFSKSSGIL